MAYKFLLLIILKKKKEECENFGIACRPNNIAVIQNLHKGMDIIYGFDGVRE